MKDIDKNSLTIVYQLFETGDIDKFEIGTTRGFNRGLSSKVYRTRTLKMQ